MSLRVAIQTDPLEGIDSSSNTTFALAEAAHQIGAHLFEYQPANLVYDSGRVHAFARPLRVQRHKPAPVTCGDRVTIDLRADVDVVLMRQDPPFDMAYITACHILERLEPDTLVVNNPAHVRSGPEKLYPLLTPQFMPPTLITRAVSAIETFRKTHGDIIVKPLYGFGGGGVFRIRPDDSNFAPLIAFFLDKSVEPLLVQAFLPDVASGDKRIILVDGKIAGGFNRIPKKGDVRSNLVAGGTAVPCELSDADHAICAAIGPHLRTRGQILVGIDIIAGHLTEVNNTSPTGVQQIRAFTGRDPAGMFWNCVKQKLAGH